MHILSVISIFLYVFVQLSTNAYLSLLSAYTCDLLKYSSFLTHCFICCWCLLHNFNHAVQTASFLNSSDLEGLSLSSQHFSTSSCLFTFFCVLLKFTAKFHAKNIFIILISSVKNLWNFNFNYLKLKHSFQRV